MPFNGSNKQKIFNIQYEFSTTKKKQLSLSFLTLFPEKDLLFES